MLALPLSKSSRRHRSSPSRSTRQEDRQPARRHRPGWTAETRRRPVAADHRGRRPRRGSASSTANSGSIRQPTTNEEGPPSFPAPPALLPRVARSRVKAGAQRSRREALTQLCAPLTLPRLGEKPFSRAEPARGRRPQREGYPATAATTSTTAFTATTAPHGSTASAGGTPIPPMAVKPEYRGKDGIPENTGFPWTPGKHEVAEFEGSQVSPGIEVKPSTLRFHAAEGSAGKPRSAGISSSPGTTSTT